MPHYPEPPNHNDWFWFLFTGFFAVLGVFTKMLRSGRERSAMSWIAEMISVGFWGGLSGWIIAYYTNLDTPMVAAISAMLGNLGHAGLIYFLRKTIMSQVGLK